MEQFLATETLIIELLLIVSLVALFVRRLRIPYTVALVVVGLLLTFQKKSEISLTPELILSLFIPPLVFEAAFHLEFKPCAKIGCRLSGWRFREFADDVYCRVIVSWGVGIPLTTGLVFGALIAATDPVAVVALFKALGAPKRLTTLVKAKVCLTTERRLSFSNCCSPSPCPLPSAAAAARREIRLIFWRRRLIFSASRRAVY